MTEGTDFEFTNMEIFRIKGAGKISEEARCLSAPTLGVRVPSFSRFGGDPEIFLVRDFFDTFF